MSSAVSQKTQEVNRPKSRAIKVLLDENYKKLDRPLCDKRSYRLIELPNSVKALLIYDAFAEKSFISVTLDASN